MSKISGQFLISGQISGQLGALNSRGFPEQGLKQGWGGNNETFSRFKHQYLDNGSRYGQNYHWDVAYEHSIDTNIDDLG